MKDVKQHTRYANSIDRVTSQIESEKHRGYVGRGVIEVLSKTIPDGENIISIVKGRFTDSYDGVLVATNKRLIFVERGFLFGTKVEDFGLDKVTSIQYETGILSATIKVMAGGNSAEIKRVSKEYAKLLCEKVRMRINYLANNNQPLPHVDNTDVVEQLTKLAKLKEQGYLTQEEFEKQKLNILEK